MKIESMEFIPMNKESIFEDPVPPTETYNVTYDRDEWAKQWKTYERNDKLDPSYKMTIAWDLVDQIKFYVTGFMTGPVALVNGKPMVARTIGVQAARAVNDQFLAHEQDGYDVFLYSVCDNNKDPSSYYIRYGIVER